jgi:hypothetical protein
LAIYRSSTAAARNDNLVAVPAQDRITAARCIAECDPTGSGLAHNQIQGLSTDYIERGTAESAATASVTFPAVILSVAATPAATPHLC